MSSEGVGGQKARGNRQLEAIDDIDSNWASPAARLQSERHVVATTTVENVLKEE